MTRGRSLVATGMLLVAACFIYGSYAASPISAVSSSKTNLLPVPGRYKIDPVHSFAYFGARHHVVGLVRGRFEKINGTIASAQTPSGCSVDVTIYIASLTTQDAERDEDLRGPDYFDAAKFPTMSYQGHGIRHVSGNKWIMDGQLTLHGHTRTVPMSFTFNGAFADQKTGDPVRVAFHGTASVKRADFGLGARDNANELGLLTTPDVAIEIDVEADAIVPTK